MSLSIRACERNPDYETTNTYKQMAQIARMRKLEEKSLPETVDYTQIRGLRLEAAEKLNAHRPANIGQASRISGVSPADISVLLVWETALQKGEQPS